MDSSSSAKSLFFFSSSVRRFTLFFNIEKSRLAFNPNAAPTPPSVLAPQA